MTPKTILRANSSSGDPYDVHFDFSDNQLTVFCNCQAGIFGKICKHKTGLLDGNLSILFNKADQEKLLQIIELVKKSKYTELMSAYSIIKKEIEEMQNKEKTIKVQIELMLKTGIEIIQ
jgi:hypothetical protein